MGLALEKLPDWPAGMNREMALAYTGVSGEQMKEWERSGKVQFRPRGPRGQMLALRSTLDAALAELFGAAAGGAPEF
jgi:hypothetical protein